MFALKERFDDSIHVDLVGFKNLTFDMSPEVLGSASIGASRHRPPGTGGYRQDVERDATTFGSPKVCKLLENVDDDNVREERGIGERTLTLNPLDDVEKERRVFGPSVLANDDQMAQCSVVGDAWKEEDVPQRGGKS